jgi:hypothetical protein
VVGSEVELLGILLRVVDHRARAKPGACRGEDHGHTGSELLDVSRGVFDSVVTYFGAVHDWAQREACKTRSTPQYEWQKANGNHASAN